MERQAHKKVGQFDRRRPYSRKDAVEFRAGKKEFIVCPDCRNVYYAKSWHADFPKNVLPERRGIRSALCPACKMVKDGRFEGQVVIENVPQNIHAELIGLVKNFGEGATRDDPQDRIIKIQSEKRRGQNTVEVFTTENQLAKRIGRRILDTYGKKIRDGVAFSKNEDIVQVHLAFL